MESLLFVFWYGIDSRGNSNHDSVSRGQRCGVNVRDRTRHSYRRCGWGLTGKRTFLLPPNSNEALDYLFTATTTSLESPFFTVPSTSILDTCRAFIFPDRLRILKQRKQRGNCSLSTTPPHPPLLHSLLPSTIPRSHDGRRSHDRCVRPSEEGSR
jgi:hypothetical protein